MNTDQITKSEGRGIKNPKYAKKLFLPCLNILAQQHGVWSIPDIARLLKDYAEQNGIHLQNTKKGCPFEHFVTELCGMLKNIRVIEPKLNGSRLTGQYENTEGFKTLMSNDPDTLNAFHQHWCEAKKGPTEKSVQQPWRILNPVVKKDILKTGLDYDQIVMETDQFRRRVINRTKKEKKPVILAAQTKPSTKIAENKKPVQIAPAEPFQKDGFFDLVRDVSGKFGPLDFSEMRILLDATKSKNKE